MKKIIQFNYKFKINGNYTDVWCIMSYVILCTCCKYYKYLKKKIKKYKEKIIKPTTMMLNYKNKKIKRKKKIHLDI